MMMTFLRIFGTCTVVLSLAACSSQEERLRITDVTKGVVSSLKKGEPRPPLSRADLNGITEPLLIVDIEKSGVQAIMGPTADNAGFVTWRTVDDSALTLRNNILTSTRKFGEDLMTSDAPTGVANHSSYRREYSYLGGDETIWKAFADCVTTVAGQETVVVLDTSYDTVVYQETCQSSRLGEIGNTYWIDTSGIAVKSRQFVSKDVGYLGIGRINL